MLFGLYLFFYSLLLAVVFGVFIVFRPFTYIDNDHSNVICRTDNAHYETSPNLIFLIDEHLDKLNDVKARKLCQYHIIRDYNNTYESPTHINYTLLPAIAYESSWINDIFVCLVTFFIGASLIEIIWGLVRKEKGKIENYLWKTLYYIIK